MAASERPAGGPFAMACARNRLLERMEQLLTAPISATVSARNLSLERLIQRFLAGLFAMASGHHQLFWTGKEPPVRHLSAMVYARMAFWPLAQRIFRVPEHFLPVARSLSMAF